MRKDSTFWLALAVAFVLGLLPGLGVVAYQRQSTDRSSAGHAAELRAKQTAWETQKEQLETQLSSAEGTVGKLQAQVTSLTAQVARLKGSAQATEAAQPSGTKPVITERTVDGQTAPGEQLTLRVKVKGDADRVTMRLVKIHPESGWVKTYELADAGVSDGVHTWKATIDCPSQKGDYRYFADAYLDDVHVTMPGTSLYTFTVE